MLTQCLPGRIGSGRKIREVPDFTGAPDTIRTCDLCLRRATLYPAELRVRGGSFADWPGRGNGPGRSFWRGSKAGTARVTRSKARRPRPELGFSKPARAGWLNATPHSAQHAARGRAPLSRKHKDADQQTCCECPQAECASWSDAGGRQVVVLLDLVGSMDHGSRPCVPDSVGGNASGPTPGVYGRAAFGSCLAIGYMMKASAMNIKINSLEVEVQADYDDGALFGTSSAAPGYLEVRYTVTVESDAAENDILQMLDIADKQSPYLDVFARNKNVSGMFILFHQKYLLNGTFTSTQGTTLRMG